LLFLFFVFSLRSISAHNGKSFAVPKKKEEEEENHDALKNQHKSAQTLTHSATSPR
jgi:hypothetical protein